MEVKNFMDFMFVPFLIQKETLTDPAIIALNEPGIMASTDWIEDPIGVCYIPNLIKIEIAFNSDIESGDISKADIYSIVAKPPPAFDLLDESRSNVIICNSIVSCFDTTVIGLPSELDIKNDLIDCDWSYRIMRDQRLYPCVVEGNIAFQCL